MIEAEEEYKNLEAQASSPTETEAPLLTIIKSWWDSCLNHKAKNYYPIPI